MLSNLDRIAHRSLAEPDFNRAHYLVFDIINTKRGESQDGARENFSPSASPYHVPGHTSYRIYFVAGHNGNLCTE